MLTKGYNDVFHALTITFKASTIVASQIVLVYSGDDTRALFG